MLTTLQITWFAGILEGEGAFTMRNGCPAIQLQMTDEDVVVRARAIMGATPRKSWKRKDGHKEVFGATITGIKAIQWMMTLYVLMGERRKAKIAEIIEAWKASKAAPRASRGTRLPAVCHPERPRKGGMLCGTCYMKKWRHDTGRHTKYYRARMATFA